MTVWEWERAGKVEGILCGDDDERRREGSCLAIDADLPFEHGLEEGALRPGLCAIDFIGEHDVGENRSLVEDEVGFLRVVYADAQDVGGEDVRGELHPSTGQAGTLGQGCGQGGFAHARDVFDEEMSRGHDAQDGQFDGFVLTFEEDVDVIPEGVETLLTPVQIGKFSHGYCWYVYLASTLSMESSLAASVGYRLEKSMRREMSLLSCGVIFRCTVSR